MLFTAKAQMVLHWEVKLSYTNSSEGLHDPGLSSPIIDVSCGAGVEGNTFLAVSPQLTWLINK